MERLILDLRSNPGGLLEQAVEVSERFIEPGKLIVYTQGRIPGSNQRFVARRSRAQVDMPLVVLVDRSSASASEIVSGAIQDHDRGLVVGETTFGKGLVQRVIPIQAGQGGAVAVTTAKYYTPSGRLIQRDYSDLHDYYLASRNEAERSEEPERIVVPDIPEVPEPTTEIFPHRLRTRGLRWRRNHAGLPGHGAPPLRPVVRIEPRQSHLRIRGALHRALSQPGNRLRGRRRGGTGLPRLS